MIFRSRYKKASHVTLLIEAESEKAGAEIKERLCEAIKRCNAKPSFLMKVEIIQK